MAKLAAAGWGFREYKTLDFFAAAKRLGLQYVEIGLDGANRWHCPSNASDAQAREMVKQANGEGVKIVAVAGEGDFTSSDREAVAKQIEIVKGQMRVAARLGADVFRAFAGWAPDMQIRDETFEGVREALESLAQYASELGIVIAIENHGSVTKTGAQCKRLLHGLPEEVGLNYDPANFRHQNEDPLAALLVAESRILYSHWKDVRPAGNTWEYCAVGEGIIAWEPIVRELIESGYEGYWAIEYEEPKDVERGTQVSLENLRRCIAAVGEDEKEA